MRPETFGPYYVLQRHAKPTYPIYKHSAKNILEVNNGSHTDQNADTTDNIILTYSSIKFNEMLLCILHVFIYAIPCGLVVRVSGYRYRGPGFDSLPDFSE